MRETHHAPDRLELVREFVNSLDIEESTDELGDGSSAADWLRQHGLGERKLLTGEERRRLIAVREAIRELLLANNAGDAPPPDALAALNAASSDIALGLRFRPQGTELVSGSGGIDAALGEVLARVHEAMGDDTWGRLKACPAPECHWAFYDRSRNRSATWCQMGECGNRNKARAFRARRRKEK
ncbi:MAG TPA: CGNR zinc finger domain-containing protein [Solirubrobacterales bacterium]|nr:CGNR zinc finger domain-containing protein [Solirubrobacterales bacterium]